MSCSQSQFELGPIRPPNEARSLLLRFTRNCPWNRCLFCPVYKKRKFSLRTIEEIQGDIKAVRVMIDDIKALSWRLGRAGEIDDAVVGHILDAGEASDSYRSVAAWLYYGTGACFLQDADNLVMTTATLVAALAYLREQLPEISRVTTYARSRSVVRKSSRALERIREAGLDRVHIGLESGHDPLLKLMQKGVRAAQHIEAGRKIMDAGMELSEYVMPGLGGRALWREHAVDTAKTLNAINPHFIRLRSLRIPRRVPLYRHLTEGTFQMQSDDRLAAELALFIEHLDGITSTVTSDHIMNLLEDVCGKLPQDKAKMLAAVRRYQELSDSDRLIYRIGRRGGAYRSPEDLRRDPATYGKLRGLVQDLRQKEGDAGVERFITELVDRYV